MWHRGDDDDCTLSISLSLFRREGLIKQSRTEGERERSRVAQVSKCLGSASLTPPGSSSESSGPRHRLIPRRFCAARETERVSSQFYILISRLLNRCLRKQRGGTLSRILITIHQRLISWALLMKNRKKEWWIEWLIGCCSEEPERSSVSWLIARCVYKVTHYFWVQR